MRQINLTLGDWSHDGHCLTETFTMLLSHDPSYDDLNRAWRLGLSKIPKQIHPTEICSDYEDSHVDEETAALISQHLEVDPEYDAMEGEDRVWVSPRMMAEMVAAVLSLGGVPCSVKEDEADDLIHVLDGVGALGYGLFSM